MSTPEPQRPLPPRASSPDSSATGGYGPSESIADTGMFRRFVAEEAELQEVRSSTRARLWVLLGLVLIVVIAVVVWLLVR